MERTAYPSDLTDEQWAIIEPFIPAPLPGGRSVTHERREIVNAILYVLRTGCGWEYLPHDLPPGKPCTITSGNGDGRGFGKKPMRHWCSKPGWQ
jgi:transposase